VKIRHRGRPRTVEQSLNQATCGGHAVATRTPWCKRRLEGRGTLKRRRPGMLSARRLSRAGEPGGSATASCTGLSESRGSRRRAGRPYSIQIVQRAGLGCTVAVEPRAVAVHTEMLDYPTPRPPPVSLARPRHTLSYHSSRRLIAALSLACTRETCSSLINSPASPSCDLSPPAVLTCRPHWVLTLHPALETFLLQHNQAE
jgi:hypothetical protein